MVLPLPVRPSTPTTRPAGGGERHVAQHAAQTVAGAGRSVGAAVVIGEGDPVERDRQRAGRERGGGPLLDLRAGGEKLTHPVDPGRRALEVLGLPADAFQRFGQHADVVDDDVGAADGDGALAVEVGAGGQSQPIAGNEEEVVDHVAEAAGQPCPPSRAHTARSRPSSCCSA